MTTKSLLPRIVTASSQGVRTTSCIDRRWRVRVLDELTPVSAHRHEPRVGHVVGGAISPPISSPGFQQVSGRNARLRGMEDPNRRRALWRELLDAAPSPDREQPLAATQDQRHVRALAFGLGQRRVGESQSGLLQHRLICQDGGEFPRATPNYKVGHVSVEARSSDHPRLYLPVKVEYTNSIRSAPSVS